MTLPLPAAPRRLVYLGTPAMAVPTLDALVAARYDVALVVTGPDARRKRRGEPEPSPVKAAALGHGLPVTHDLDDVAAVDADLGVVVAYGRIIPAGLLDVLPMVNLHFSLLPRWRGAAPVERALLAGDSETGVCVMDVVDALDEGDVYAKAIVPITVDSTLESLRSELVAVGTDLLLSGLSEGFGEPEVQRGVSTYAHKIDRAELRLDFTADAETARRAVAVGDAWTMFRERRLKVHRVVVGDEVVDAPPGALRIVRGQPPSVATADRWIALDVVQPEGRKRVRGVAWANGVQPRDGERLGP